MEYKKRDRIGEIYFDWTVIGQGTDNRTWIMRCKCGREKTVKADRMHASRSCISCSKKATSKNLGKFLSSVNDLAPKHPTFKPDVVYELEYSRCLYPLYGKLVNEYQKTACFEIVDCNISDRDLIRNIGNRIVVRKEEVVKVS